MRGFTLIELLVTVAIVAALAALLLPAVSLVSARAKRTATEQRLAQIGNACEAYVLLTRRAPDEQGVAWTWDATARTAVPRWIAAPEADFPVRHRECVSILVNRPDGGAGLADRLRRHGDLLIPAEALAKGGPVDGMTHLVDGWGQPLRYQRISEVLPGALAARAAWWLMPGGVARVPPPAIAGRPGERDGFVLYSVGRGGTRERLPADVADDSEEEPGRWWADPATLIWRRAGQ